MDSVLARLLIASTQAAVYFCFVWALCLTLRRMPAALKCWLWRSVTLKFVIGLGFLITLPISAPTKRANAGPVNQMESVVLRAVPKSEPGMRTENLPVGPPGKPAGKIGLGVRAHPISSFASATPDSSNSPLLESAIIAAWLLGAAMLMFRGVVAYRRVRQILLDSGALSPDVALEGMSRVVERWGDRRSVRVRVLQDLSAPALLGFRHPTIVLPADFDGTSPEAITSAFAHELAHLSRRDGLWILFAEIVKALFWFHPCAWLACRQQRVEAEIAADRLARTWTETSPREYAGHLLEWISPERRRRISVCAVPGLVPSTHELIMRVKAMALPRYSGRSSRVIGTVVGLPLAIALIPIMLVIAGGPGLANSPWPKFHGGLDNSGRGLGFGAKGVMKWSFKSGDQAGDPSIGPDGEVYIGSGDNCVYALDGGTGKKKWSFRTNLTVTSTPTVAADGTIYVGSQDRKLYALDGKTGVKKWSFSTGGLIYPAATLGSDGTVYIGSWDGQVYALDGATGVKKWSFRTDGPVTSDPAIGKDGTLYIGSHGRKLYALDGVTGREIWSFEGDDTLNSPSLGSNGVLYVGSLDGRIYALSEKTGALLWRSQTGDFVDGCPAIGLDGTIYVGSEDHRVYALNGKTGKRIWAFVTAAPVQASPAIAADGAIYVGSLDQKFYALDGRTGSKLWEFAGDGGFASSPAIGSDGTIYVGTDAGTVYAIR